MGNVKLFSLFLVLTIFPTVNLVGIPKFSSTCSRYLGDINIAVFIDLTVPHASTLCLDRKNGYWNPYVVQLEAFVYKLREINQREDILPNITLGFVAMDTCFSALAAVAQFTNLVSEPTTQDPSNNTVGTNTSISCEQISQDSNRIVGINGPSTSDQAIHVAVQAGVFRIPLLSTLASTYELSDKGRYQYFSRLLSPNPKQVEASLDFLQYHNWTYISFVYLEGNYGEGAAKTMLKSARSRGICLAVYEMYPSSATNLDVQEIARRLAAKSAAKVVVAYLYENHIKELFAALEQYPDYKPIWFGSSAISSQPLGLKWQGAFTINAVLNMDPEFENYMAIRKPSVDGEGNRWLAEWWERTLSCSWTATAPSNTSSTMTPCSYYQNSSVSKPAFYSPYSGKYIEAAQVFSLALDALIRANCPEVFKGTNSSSQIYYCVKEQNLLDYLRVVDFEGINGPVAFDANGDRLSHSSINQYVYDPNTGSGTYSVVGDYNGRNLSLTIYGEKINWTVYDDVAPDTGMAESVCSKPCGAKQYVVLTEELCCWECRTCRSNEKLNTNGTDCEPCPMLTWPDDASATYCETIPQAFTTFSDPLGTVLLVVAILGSIIGVLTTAWYVKNKDEKLIRASSRELSAFILAGVILAYVSIFFFLIRPSGITCLIRLSTFHVSVSLIFGPLFVKTNRIYRIFSAGKRGVKSPTFIGNKVQVAFTILIIFIQLLVTIIVNIVVESKPKPRQPVPTERFVELNCSLPLGALLPGLVFNLTLLSACAVYGYLTRKLPANFNESWYIFVSVATTLFLWMVFIPAYFTAFYASHQVVLLCCCLFFNASVTLVCLFWPKIYALTAKNERELNLASTTNTSSTAVAN